MLRCLDVTPQHRPMPCAMLVRNRTFLAIIAHRVHVHPTTLARERIQPVDDKSPTVSLEVAYITMRTGREKHTSPRSSSCGHPPSSTNAHSNARCPRKSRTAQCEAPPQLDDASCGFSHLVGRHLNASCFCSDARAHMGAEPISGPSVISLGGFEDITASTPRILFSPAAEAYTKIPIVPLGIFPSQLPTLTLP